MYCTCVSASSITLQICKLPHHAGLHAVVTAGRRHIFSPGFSSGESVTGAAHAQIVMCCNGSQPCLAKQVQVFLVGFSCRLTPKFGKTLLVYAHSQPRAKSVFMCRTLWRRTCCGTLQHALKISSKQPAWCKTCAAYWPEPTSRSKPCAKRYTPLPSLPLTSSLRQANKSHRVHHTTAALHGCPLTIY